MSKFEILFHELWKEIHNQKVHPSEFNPLLHKLFFDHDIILFVGNIEIIHKQLSKVSNASKNIMESGAFVSKKQMLYFR